MYSLVNNLLLNTFIASSLNSYNKNVLIFF